MKYYGIVYIICLFFFAGNLFAQKSDKDLIKSQHFVKKEYAERKVIYGFSPGKKRNYNPLYHILSTSMYVYQSQLSPQLSRGCGFNPSCSAYSKNLIKEYGIVKGTFCSADRLMRCNRISLTGKSYLIDIHDHKIHEDVDRYNFSKINP